MMQQKSFAPIFLLSFLSVILVKLEAANAQGAAAVERAVVNHGDDVVRAAPGILATIMALFTENPLLSIIVVIVVLVVVGKALSQAS